MRVKNKKLEWNALIHDFNSDSIKKYNIFSESFKEDLYKKYRAKKLNTKAELKEEIVKYCKYHFWSRTEYEIAMGGLFSKYPEKFDKIDIWFQLEMNIDHIVDYVNTYLEINVV